MKYVKAFTLGLLLVGIGDATMNQGRLRTATVKEVRHVGHVVGGMEWSLRWKKVGRA